VQFVECCAGYDVSPDHQYKGIENQVEVPVLGSAHRSNIDEQQQTEKGSDGDEQGRLIECELVSKEQQKAL
jgi:hypothetical protein